MTKLSPKVPFFIFGSILAIVDTSRGDDTIVTVADDSATCTCPPDLSEQLRTTLTNECDSKLEVLNNDLTWYDNALKDCESNFKKFEEDANRIFEEQVTRSVAECDSKLAVSNEDIKWFDANLNDCRSQHGTYVENTNRELDDTKIMFNRCETESAVISDERSTLESEVSSLREASAIQMERCDDSISTCNDLLSSTQMENAQCNQKMKGCISNTEQSKLKKENEQLKKNVKMEQKRYYDEKENANRLEKDLTAMRRNAEVTYVNTTLMKNNIVGFTSNNMNRVYDAYANVVSKVQQLPLINSVETKARDLYGMVSDRIEYLYSNLW